MNNSKLLETINYVLSLEKTNAVQTRLAELHAALANLASQPTQPSHQSAVATALEALNSAVTKMRDQLTPTQQRYVFEINGEEFFSNDIASDTGKSIAQNAATPTVAAEQLKSHLDEREKYLARLRQLQGDLKAIGVTTTKLEVGEAEIGFLLPRKIFENDLDGLIKELSTVKRVVRAFSEVSIGTAEKIEIRQISTTDPIFTFLLAPATIVAIAKSVSWALETWKSVEEIRHLRAQTAQLSVFDGSDVEKLFDEKIEQTIDERIDAKLNELLSKVPDRNGRKNEERNLLSWSLRSLLAHIERGVVVEVKVLPPPTPKAEEGKPPPPADPVYSDLTQISKNLEFPRIEGDPILSIEPPPPEKAESGRKSPPHVPKK